MQSPFQATLSNVRRMSIELLDDIFNDRRLAQFVREEALMTVLEEIVRRLADPLLMQARAEEKQNKGEVTNEYYLEFKMLEAITHRILMNSDRTAMYVVLFRLLSQASSTAIPAQQETDYDVQRAAYQGLVLSCLWRVVKALDADLRKQFSGADGQRCERPAFGDMSKHPFIRAEAILRESHRFFVRVPDREWRKRKDESEYYNGDYPKRTVMTVIHSMARLMGGGGVVWRFCGLVLRDAISEHPDLEYAVAAAGARAAAATAAAGAGAQDSDPVLVKWANDVHRRMEQVSEAWAHLGTALEGVDERFGRPSPSQLITALRVAQAVGGEGGGDGDGDSSDSETLPAVAPAAHPRYYPQHVAGGPGSRAASPAAYGRGAAVRSPQMQAAVVAAAAGAAAGAAGGSSMSSQERLRVLRERIHGGGG
ncbi:hypothetical protein EV174_005979, partial [Coemansia sp. RSA 2320]